MKKYIFSMMLVMFSFSAFADVTSNSQSGSTSGAMAGSAIVLDQSAHNSGNVAASDLSNMVPSVTAPNLATTLTETCMGSSSVGASGAGFGFSFGTTWRDSACVRRLDARQLSAFGEVPVAIEMMCDSELVREAAKRAGRPCVADGGQPRQYPQMALVAPTQEVPTPEAAAPVVNEQVRE